MLIPKTYKPTLSGLEQRSSLLCKTFKVKLCFLIPINVINALHSGKWPKLSL